MKPLSYDTLIFVSSDESILCSAERVTIELVGKGKLEPAVIRKASRAVARHFRVKLRRERVLMQEFSKELKRVLERFGYIVTYQQEIIAFPA